MNRNKLILTDETNTNIVKKDPHNIFSRTESPKEFFLKCQSNIENKREEQFKNIRPQSKCIKNITKIESSRQISSGLATKMNKLNFASWRRYSDIENNKEDVKLGNLVSEGNNMRLVAIQRRNHILPFHLNKLRRRSVIESLSSKAGQSIIPSFNTHPKPSLLKDSIENSGFAKNNSVNYFFEYVKHKTSKNAKKYRDQERKQKVPIKIIKTLLKPINFPENFAINYANDVNVFLQRKFP